MEETEKSEQTFIAYMGKEFKSDEMKDALFKRCANGCFVSTLKWGGNLTFLKIVKIGDGILFSDPNWNSDYNVLTVGGYNQDEIKEACKNYSRYDSNNYCALTNFMYRDYKTDMFKELEKHMHFCSVVWDADIRSLIAGVTKPNSRYTHLYYGYTKQNHELMFSNDEDILKQFCDEIFEMQENTYMINGELYSNGKKIEGGENTSLIKKSKENDDESVKPKIEQNIEDYLSSDDVKEKMNEFFSKELDNETQKQVLMMIKKCIEEHKFEDDINSKLEEIFNEKLEEYRSKIQVPVVHIVKLNDTVLGQTKEGFYHERFEQILSQVQLDEPIMLIGPAGSGKNVAVKQVADALGKHMYYTNNASNEFKLTGFIDAGGNYRETEFYKAFKNGGIFFLDEIDCSDASALIVINSAIANGYMAFPHETINRHADFRIVTAANTWGKGADLQYVGRNVLDAATLDRFDNIFFDYDTNLEAALYPNEEVLEFMWAFRDAVYKTKIPHIVSTRGIGKVYKKEINGIAVQDILTSNIVKNLGQDDVNTIIGRMQNINSSNKYYEGIKSLRLNR